MCEVSLSGQLVADGPEQAAIVDKHLPLHLELTRAEEGCLLFEVSPTNDPLVWQVDEVFRDATAFRAHQSRVSSSDWGRETSQIKRQYKIEGLSD